MLVELIKPAPKYGEELFDAEQLYAEWKKAHEEALDIPPPQNIRFPHNPNWRTESSTLSLQAAHNRTGIWKPVSWLFYGALMTLTAFSTWEVIGWQVSITLAIWATYRTIKRSI